MTMHQHLGKRDPKIDARTLRLVDYIDQLPEPPAACDYLSPRATWPMFRNDEIGDCTCAAAGHKIINWRDSFDGPDDRFPTDKDIVTAYSRASQYDPVTGSGDRGAYALDVLKLWKNVGVGDSKIHAFISLDRRDISEVKLAISLFGGIYLGMSLPRSAKGQGSWEVAPWYRFSDRRAGGWGGHAIMSGSYDSEHLSFISWGARMRMTWDFFEKYCDEAYAVLSEDWVDAQTRKAPSGFDFDQLAHDLALLE